MNSILEPLLAILAIFVPLGMAYVILLFQSRKPADRCRKESTITHNNLLNKMAKLSLADEKNAARSGRADSF